MTVILPLILALGLLIFVHELGHFLVAKAVGVRVLKFSLGFGRSIISFERGGTEYAIGIFPFGGYVKMAGLPLSNALFNTFSSISPISPLL